MPNDLLTSFKSKKELKGIESKEVRNCNISKK